jgi:hypothetical protein
MLEIVRGRTWVQTHTVYDDADQTVLSDLSDYTAFRSQIREKVAVRNKAGFFEHKLVAEVAVSVLGSVVTQTITRAQTLLLNTGEYLIDLTADDEALLEPEPIKVVNRPTSPL